MDRPLYLHEVVDVVGRGSAAYMDHVVGFDPAAVADRGLELAGTWEVVGTTGRWPQVVNLWRFVDGWDGWLRLTRRTNVAKRDNVELAGWWDEAHRHRSGGVDRLLAAAPGSPDAVGLAESGVRGEVAVHELTRVRPGAALDYLGTLAERLAPALAEKGMRLVGAYEVLMTDVEVVTVWVGSLEAHTALMRAEVEGPPLVAGYVESRRQWATAYREELMVPGPGSPFHPSTA